MYKEKKERNVKIVKDIQGGRLTYSEIGEKYTITRQRVYQFEYISLLGIITFLGGKKVEKQ